MDPRRFGRRWLPALVAKLDQFNHDHPWSHNDHFHRWIIGHLPASRRSALDVGCGRGGLLVKLAEHFDQALGTDLDAEMRTDARRTIAHYPHASVVGQQLTEMDGPYDLVTMVAVLHHLDIHAALAESRRLLAPGGRLLVVGLARPDTMIDWVWDAVCLVSNPVIGVIKHPRRAVLSTDGPGFPVVEPKKTYVELRRIFDNLLPAAKLRRRVGFRYTAEWTKPV